MKDYEKIGDHTIKKFELVSEYAKGWAHKILGYSQSAGLIYIDCMCNCGKYYDNNGNIVEGTAIRVARIINQINVKFTFFVMSRFFVSVQNPVSQK